MTLPSAKNPSTERYRFIELLAYWEGQVNNPMLQAQFGLSRQQSSAHFGRYQKLVPNNLTYNASQKVYLPKPNFVSLYLSGQVEEYLEWVQFGRLRASVPHLNCESMATPKRHVDPLIMRALVQALRQQKRVEVEYTSLSNPTDQSRLMSPHSFVNTGIRWHLRAYCEKSGSYRDFVLSRFCGQAELDEKSTHTAAQDQAWNTQVTVILKSDPRLSARQKQVLENDFQMVDGQLSITTRGCLVNYLLRELQVSVKMLEVMPEAQQLVLVNLVDIKPWLFEG